MGEGETASGSLVVRSIVEEKDVSRTLTENAQKYPRLEDLWEGWKWRLARGPEIDAVEIPGLNPKTWLIKAGDYSQLGAPKSLTILYRFNDDEVNILAIKIE